MTVTDDIFDPRDKQRAETRRRAPSVRHVPEKERTNLVLGWLNDLPGTYAYKLHTGPMSEGGHPDIDCCSNGRAVKIEMKGAGEWPSKRQFARLKRWQEAGALVGWAEGIEHAQQIMNRIDDPQYRNPLTGPGAP